VICMSLPQPLPWRSHPGNRLPAETSISTLTGPVLLLWQLSLNQCQQHGAAVVAAASATGDAETSLLLLLPSCGPEGSGGPGSWPTNGGSRSACADHLQK
jgi:hypothetical protein